MYINEVQYPISLTSDILLKEVSATVKNLFENFIETNAELKSLVKESGNPISISSTKTVKDCKYYSCASANESGLCHTLLATIEMDGVSTSDIRHL